MKFHVGPYVYRIAISREPIIDDDGDALLGQASYGKRQILIAASVRAENRLDVLLHELRHCWLFHFPRPRTEEEDCNFSAAVMAQAAIDLEAQGGTAAVLRMKPVAMNPVHRAQDAIAAAAQIGGIEESLDQPPRADARDDDAAAGFLAASAAEGDFDSLLAPSLDASLDPSPSASDFAGPRLVAACYVQEADTAASPHGGRAQCGICETVVAAGMIVSDEPRWSIRYGGLVARRGLYCPHCNHLQIWTEGCDKSASPNGSVADGPHYQRGRPVEEFLAAHPQAAGIVAE